MSWFFTGLCDGWVNPCAIVIGVAVGLLFIRR